MSCLCLHKPHAFWFPESNHSEISVVLTRLRCLPFLSRMLLLTHAPPATKSDARRRSALVGTTTMLELRDIVSEMESSPVLYPSSSCNGGVRGAEDGEMRHCSSEFTMRSINAAISSRCEAEQSNRAFAWRCVRREGECGRCGRGQVCARRRAVLWHSSSGGINQFISSSSLEI